MPRIRNRVPEVPSSPVVPWAPSRPFGFSKSWEGPFESKPWNYKVAVAIPHLDTPETVPTVIELLRLQTVRPFIMVIDTGSLPEHWDKIEALAGEDVEVHRIRLNGVVHPSDPVAMAMDLAMTLCRSEYLFCTHTDVFPRRRDLLEDLMTQAEESQVVGYEITPRANIEWQGMVSHTATMIRMKFADQIGLGWSQRRLMNLHGIDHYGPEKCTGGWPDTEVLMNYIFRQNGFRPTLIGTEQNFERTLDENIDHVRSLPGSKQYSPAHFAKANSWLNDAMRSGYDRILKWRKHHEKSPVQAARQS